MQPTPSQRTESEYGGESVAGGNSSAKGGQRGNSISVQKRRVVVQVDPSMRSAFGREDAELHKLFCE